MKIAIWGMGVSGVSALRYLSEQNKEIYAVNSGKVEDWKNISEIEKYIPRSNCLSEESVSEIFDQIILSPGIDKRKGKIKEQIDKGVDVINDIELVYQKSQFGDIAITGTNGKTTTATMMQIAFEKAGKKVFCGGNIGIPACDYFLDEYDFSILELSSFQLESIKSFQTKVGIILNITASHMERYESVDEYKNAKLRLFENRDSKQLFLADKDYIKDIGIKKILKISDYDFSNSHLIGEHHKENLFCVEQALKYFKVDNYQEIIQQIINEFTGVKFRLQFEKQIGDLRFINDGKSTNIDATLAAIDSLESDNLSVILGGQLRSKDIEFVDALKTKQIKKLYLFGEARELIQQRLKNDLEIESFEKLEDVITEIKNKKQKGTILFSPAFPSFDQYKNYLERGEHFSKLVNL